MTPTRFGKYEVVDSIAMGGMGEVYLARAPGLAGFEKLVALKVIRSDLVHNREFVDALVAEAKLAVRLHHTNIVQVFDLGLDGERYFLAMEYVDGLDVYRMVGRARAAGVEIPCAVAAYVAAEVAAGADYAHNRRDERGVPLGIIHRDLNPHNVLVGYGGEVKIADFGIAKVRAHAKTTAAGVIKGKLTYLSPEQARAEKTDHRADIFGIGIVLYETLTGQKLYRREADISAVLARVKDADFIKPRKRRRDIPKALEAIVLQALQRDPNKRYQSAEALRDALMGWLHESTPEFNRRSLEEFMRALREQPGAAMPVLEPTLRKRKRPLLGSESSEGAFDAVEGPGEDEHLDDTDPGIPEIPSLARPAAPPAAPPRPQPIASPVPVAGLQRPTVAPPPATPVPSFGPVPAPSTWGAPPRAPIAPPALATRPGAPARPAVSVAAARSIAPEDTGDAPFAARNAAPPQFGEISTDSETGSTSRMTPDEVLAAARWVAEMSGQHPVWLPPAPGSSALGALGALGAPGGADARSELSDRVGQQLVAVRRRRVEQARAELSSPPAPAAPALSRPSAASASAAAYAQRSIHDAAGPTYRVSSQEILALAAGPSPTPAEGEPALRNKPAFGSPSLSGELAAVPSTGFTVPLEYGLYATGQQQRVGMSNGMRVLLGMLTLVLLLGAAALALILTSG